MESGERLARCRMPGAAGGHWGGRDGGAEDIDKREHHPSPYSSSMRILLQLLTGDVALIDSIYARLDVDLSHFKHNVGEIAFHGKRAALVGIRHQAPGSLQSISMLKHCREVWQGLATSTTAQIRSGRLHQVKGHVSAMQVLMQYWSVSCQMTPSASHWRCPGCLRVLEWIGTTRCSVEGRGETRSQGDPRTLFAVHLVQHGALYAALPCRNRQRIPRGTAG